MIAQLSTAALVRGAWLGAPLVALLLQDAGSTAPADAPAPKSAPPKQEKPAPAATDGWVLPDWPTITFKEVAKSSGVDVTNLSGAPEIGRASCRERVYVLV